MREEVEEEGKKKRKMLPWGKKGSKKEKKSQKDNRASE